MRERRRPLYADFLRRLVKALHGRAVNIHHHFFAAQVHDEVHPAPLDIGKHGIEGEQVSVVVRNRGDAQTFCDSTQPIDPPTRDISIKGATSGVLARTQLVGHAAPAPCVHPGSPGSMWRSCRLLCDQAT